MQFSVKQHNKNDFYETFNKWLVTQNFPQIHKDNLPENCFVCYADDIPCYCIWVYFTDSKLVWIGFPASNKNVSYKQKQGGLDFLINYVVNYLKKKKMKTIFTTSDTESVVNSLIKNEFISMDLNVTQYIKTL